MNTNARARLNLSPSWELEYSTLLNLTEGQVLSQHFVLTRDLHCWTASFTRSFNVSGESEYYFKLGIKEQKEIYLERGSREMSFGGIR